MSRPIDIRKLRESVQPVIKTAEATPGTSRRVSENFWNRDLSIGRATLNNTAKESFYLELSSMLNAGIDIRTALELVASEQKNKKARKIFASLLDFIIAGMSLSGAMGKSGNFTIYEYRTVQIGEETGKLLVVLEELSKYFKKRARQRQQVIGALTYPAIVLVVAFSAIIFMVNYVVPMFSDTFRRFGNDLPAITSFIVSLSVSFRKFFGLFLAVVAAIFVIIYWQRKTTWFRKAYTSLILRIPVIGDITKKIYLSRFTGTMALLTGSRVPIVQAIQLCRQMVGFYPIESSLAAIEEKITNGISLHESLSHFPIYPPKMVSVIKVAEEVNQLDSFFERLSEQYAGDAEYASSLLGKFIEPFIIVILGVVVGIILIAMYLPLFRLGQTF